MLELKWLQENDSERWLLEEKTHCKNIIMPWLNFSRINNRRAHQAIIVKIFLFNKSELEGNINEIYLGKTDLTY